MNENLVFKLFLYLFFYTLFMPKKLVNKLFLNFIPFLSLIKLKLKIFVNKEIGIKKRNTLFEFSFYIFIISLVVLFVIYERR